MGSPLDELLKALSPVGVAPRSGRCMECGNALKPTDTDHSFCNTCWDDMLAHPYNPYIDLLGNEICDTCGMPSDEHTKWKVGD